MDSFALCLPTGFPMDVLEIMKREPKICNYIDIPLQHISDSILKSIVEQHKKKRLNY
jgi:tRNA A37 methylthiotransferase MiaB